MPPIKLVRSKRKTLCIEVTSSCEVIVRAPLRVSEKEINRFIGEKADWIEKSLSKMKLRQNKKAEENSNLKRKREINRRIFYSIPTIYNEFD